MPPVKRLDHNLGLVVVVPKSTHGRVTATPSSALDRGVYHGRMPHVRQKRRTAVRLPHWYSVVSVNQASSSVVVRRS